MDQQDIDKFEKKHLWWIAAALGVIALLMLDITYV